VACMLLARYLMGLADKRCHAAGFFCWQAVEKELKAYGLPRTCKAQAPETVSHSPIHLGNSFHLPRELHNLLRDMMSK